MLNLKTKERENGELTFTFAPLVDEHHTNDKTHDNKAPNDRTKSNLKEKWEKSAMFVLVHL